MREMRGIPAIFIILAATGCASTIGMLPGFTQPKGTVSFAPSMSFDRPVGADGSALPLVPVIGLGLAAGLDDSTDVALRLSSILGVAGSLRRLMTDPSKPGPSLLLEGGGALSATFDFGWLNLHGGLRIGVPFGPGSARETSHLLLGARLNLNLPMLYCDIADAERCTGPKVAPSALLGLAIRATPDVWFVLEAAYQSPIRPLNAGPTWVGATLSGLVGPGVVEFGASVLVPWGL